MAAIHMLKVDEDKDRLVTLNKVFLSSGGTLDVYDSSGNLVLRINENGDILTDGVMGPLP